jgi:DNA (cytosine-5)-methyltransferase 1
MKGQIMLLMSQKTDLPWSPFIKKDGSKKVAKTALNHISLFSGAGGTDLGLHYAGFKTLFANDIEKNAIETFWHNLDKSKKIAVIGDITKVNLPKFKGEKIDLLTAGFPCQPFSNAGDRLGTKDPRGQLYLSVLKAVDYYKPTVVMLENVRGITTSLHNGKLVIETIMENLLEKGYKVSFKLVDSSDYRVGQKRLRLLIIGTKMKSHFVFPPIRDKKSLTLGEILNYKTVKIPNYDERLKLSPGTDSMLKLVPIGGSWKDVPYNKLTLRFRKIRDNMKKYHAPKFYRKFTKDDICGTMTAAFTPENSCVWNPCNDKLMSVRDCARVQSFPDWFQFSGSTIRSKHKQIGNAIPPRLAYEIGNALRNHIEAKQDSKKNGPVQQYSEIIKGKKTVSLSDKTIVFA